MAELSRRDYWEQRFAGLLKRIAFRFGLVVAMIVFELLAIFCCVIPPLLLQNHVPEFIFEIAEIVTLLTFVSINLLLLFFAVRPPKKWRDRWVQRDAERRLREKKSTGYRPGPVLRKIIRQTIWTPILLTILALLFLPELVGAWSQRYLSRPVTISGHPIHVPRTWIFWGQSRTGEGHEYVNLIIMKGGTGKIRHWWNWNPPIADFSVESYATKNSLYREQGRFLRTIKNQGLELRCWQRPLHPLHYQAVLIDCSSANGEMTAEFLGNEIYLEDFYAAIEK